MRVNGVGFSNMYFPSFQAMPAVHRSSGAPVMSKNDMLRVLGLMMYNQTGIPYKLARIAAQMYAGMNLDQMA